MPYTVAVSFDKFRENIEPPNYERNIANNRKERLKKLLRNDFDLLDAFASGSLPRYTAVKDHADLDIIVVLDYDKHIKNKKPSQVLLSIRNCLKDYRTNIRRNGQAVTLYYETWPNVDIVPVSRVDNDDGSIAHYNVPNMNDETWIKSQPKKHSKNLNSSNSNYGVEFKRIIKMIKWWNHQHNSLLQSYHIEVLALKILSGSFKEYPWDIYKFFDASVDLVKLSLTYDSYRVETYLDLLKIQDIVKSLENARDKAMAAWYLTYNNNEYHEDAIKIWRDIFGDKFPAYG